MRNRIQNALCRSDILQIFVYTFTEKRELGAIIDVDVVAQQEASSVGQWDLSPGQENVSVLLGCRQGDRTGRHCGRTEPARREALQRVRD